MITIRGSLEPPGLFPRIAPPPVRAPPAGIAENRIAPWRTRTIAAEALRAIVGHLGAAALEAAAAVTATTAGAEAGSAISEAEAAADMEGEAVMGGAAGTAGAVMVEATVEDMAGVRPTVAPLTAVRMAAALTVGVMVVPLMAARLMAGIADTNSHG